MKQVFFAGRSSVRALTAGALAACLLSAGAAAAGAAGAAYSDLGAGHWAYEAVSVMSESGIVNGYPDGSFRPSGLVTYGEFIKMAYTAATGDDPGANAGAAEAGQSWARPYYDAALAARYFTIYDISSFDLGNAIPRGDAALILSYILDSAKGEDYDYDDDIDSAALLKKISDITIKTDNMYCILKTYAAGLITGYPDGTFRPEGTLTRAEAATVIRRLIDESARVLPSDGDEEEETPAKFDPYAPSDRPAIERVNPESPYLPLNAVVLSSVSTKPISDILDETMLNYKGEPILYYEIFENYPYKMKVVPDLSGGEMLTVGYDGVEGWLIKDRKIIAELSSGYYREEDIGATGPKGVYGEKFPVDFDYIAVVSWDGRVALLIPKNM